MLKISADALPERAMELQRQYSGMASLMLVEHRQCPVMDRRLFGGLNSVPYWYRCDTVVMPIVLTMYYRSQRCDTKLLPITPVWLRYVSRAPVAPRNGSAALWWPIVVFQVLSRRSSADVSPLLILCSGLAPARYIGSV